MQDFVMWLWNHYIEVLGTLLGILYVVLSVKQNIWTWPVGLLCSILYIYVYLDAKFYADMALQVYYVAVSIYGWVQWLKRSPDFSGEKESKLMVSKTPHQMCWYLVVISLLLFVFIYFILSNYTDSPVPVGDAITTALSVVATWMLAKKYIEHWIVWVFIDGYSAYLYAEKGLWPTMVLFVVYLVIATVGYLNWNKELKEK